MAALAGVVVVESHGLFMLVSRLRRRKLIWAEVARQTGVPAERFKKGDESRGMPITAYRQLAMALMCRLTKLHLNTIAQLFGLRNHTTIIHTKRAVGFCRCELGKIC
jgi:chromosomal replication initiation ATPase DnaA